jgi:hypothetical protein
MSDARSYESMWDDIDDQSDPAFVPADVAYRRIHPAQQRELRSTSYAKYLESPHWATTRKRALHRAGFQCAGCEAKSFLDVHHRSYKNLGRENEADLMVLCRKCHEFIHWLQDSGASQMQVDHLLYEQPHKIRGLRAISFDRRNDA